MCDIQGSGTHLQKEMMVVNDKDYNMITVLVERWAVAIYTARSKHASMQTCQYEILGQHARHACYWWEIYI